MNDLETGRNGHDAQIDPAAARMSDLLAFQFAIERGDPGSVMCSYNRVNGDFACENEWLLTTCFAERLRLHAAMSCPTGARRTAPSRPR